MCHHKRYTTRHKSWVFPAQRSIWDTPHSRLKSNDFGKSLGPWWSKTITENTAINEINNNSSNDIFPGFYNRPILPCDVHFELGKKPDIYYRSAEFTSSTLARDPRFSKQHENSYNHHKFGFCSACVFFFFFFMKAKSWFNVCTKEQSMDLNEDDLQCNVRQIAPHSVSHYPYHSQSMIHWISINSICGETPMEGTLHLWNTCRLIALGVTTHICKHTL